MASSASGQHEPNPALWLATREGKMELSCRHETTYHVPHEKFSRKPYNTEILYWPGLFGQEYFFQLWIDSVKPENLQKKN